MGPRGTDGTGEWDGRAEKAEARRREEERVTGCNNNIKKKGRRWSARRRMMKRKAVFYGWTDGRKTERKRRIE